MNQQPIQWWIPCNLKLVLWPFDTKIIRPHTLLIENLYVQFHDSRCKGKAVIIFSNQWIATLTFDQEINREHPQLMGNLCMKFHYFRCTRKAMILMCQKSFSVINALWHWPFEKKKSIGSILDSWGICLWNFMITVVWRESSYAPKTIFSNQCIVTLTFEILTKKSKEHILNSWSVCMWSFMITGLKRKHLRTKNHFQ